MNRGIKFRIQSLTFAKKLKHISWKRLKLHDIALIRGLCAFSDFIHKMAGDCFDIEKRLLNRSRSVVNTSHCPWKVVDVANLIFAREVECPLGCRTMILEEHLFAHLTHDCPVSYRCVVAAHSFETSRLGKKEMYVFYFDSFTFQHLGISTCKAIFRGLVLGCVEAVQCRQMLFLQHFRYIQTKRNISISTYRNDIYFYIDVHIVVSIIRAKH